MVSKHDWMVVTCNECGRKAELAPVRTLGTLFSYIGGLAPSLCGWCGGSITIRYKRPPLRQVWPVRHMEDEEEWL